MILALRFRGAYPPRFCMCRTMVAPLRSQLGFSNWVGWMALFFALLILLASLPIVKRHLYEVFRSMHWLFLLVIAFTSVRGA